MNHSIARAHVLIAQAKWDLAERELRGVLTQDPNLAHAHALLALCLSVRQQYAEATGEAESAIHLAPDDPFGHYVLACVYNDRSRFKEARQAVHEAIRLNPFDATPWGLLALVEYALQHWSAALEAAERGLQVDPEDSRCANARSMALVKLGRTVEAAAAVAETLSREPENALSQATQGWTLLEQGNPRGAQVCFREALRLEPGMQWARAGMVTALKARNPFYRLVLSYFLWMSKLGNRVQWALVIGLFFGVRLLNSAAEQMPALQPLVTPIVYAYVAFCLVSWLADPLFNLLLRLDRFGKYVLSRDEILGANLVALCLLGTVLGIVVAVAVGSPTALLAGLACVLLAIPCSAVFRCDKGWPRHAMGLYALGLVILGVLGLAAIGLDIAALKMFGGLFLLGVLFSGWVANGLIAATVRS
jgi:tetratricopeptide (TPR) repeat protein